MEPESSLLFGIASRLPSEPTRVAHHDEIGGRRGPLHNAIDLIGSYRAQHRRLTDIRRHLALPSRSDIPNCSFCERPMGERALPSPDLTDKLFAVSLSVSKLT